MIALLLALAAPQAAPRLICTHEQTGRIVQGRLLRRQIVIRLGRRWHSLPYRQAEWSCMPADRRRTYPSDPE